MSKWTTTPFQSLEAARAVSEMLGADPQPYDGPLPAGYEAFTSLDETGGRILVAQDVVNGGPVRQRQLSAGPPMPREEPQAPRRRRRRKRKEPLPLQDPTAPRWRSEDRKGVGPWSMTTHFDLGQAVQHAQLAVTNPGELTYEGGTFVAITFPDGDIYEYLELAPGRVLVRVLSSGTAPPPREGVTPPVAAGGEEVAASPPVSSTADQTAGTT